VEQNFIVNRAMMSDGLRQRSAGRNEKYQRASQGENVIMVSEQLPRKSPESRLHRATRVSVFTGVLVSALVFSCMNADSATSDESSRRMRTASPEAGQEPSTSSSRMLMGGRTPEAYAKVVEQGKQIFRYDTFGDEAFWGDTLRLHEAVAKLPPSKVLELGLKVDSDALPDQVIKQLKAGKLNLNDPAVTLTLLKLNAVVGVTGHLDSAGKKLTSIGVQCALCHSTVDDSLAPGIGHRRDGWAARDLNIGAIIASAPDLSFFTKHFGLTDEKVREILRAWGPGKFDAVLPLDGKAFRPDGKTAAVLIPPASGLTGINLHTGTGWGSVSYWNAYVANLAMRGKGTFLDSRLNDDKFPLSAAHPKLFGDKRDDVDLITAKLPALHLYQLALAAPVPPKGSFDRGAALRGRQLFNDKARCASCHVPPIFTDPGFNMHAPEEIGIDAFQAERSPNPQPKYRTAPLKGLWARQKGGFYHDGRFATLGDVVNHYDSVLKLGLSAAEKKDLVQYLLSLPAEL